MVHLDYSVQAMPRGFAFSVGRREGRELCLSLFDARFYDPAGVHALVGRYRGLAAEAGRHPDRPVGELVAAGARRARVRSGLAKAAAPALRARAKLR